MSILSELLSTLLWRGSDESLREQVRHALLTAHAWEWPLIRDLVVAHPASDGPRLLAADWLTDDGQETRARLIALQCRAAYLRDIFGAEAEDQSEWQRLLTELRELLTPLTSQLTANLVFLDDVQCQLTEDGTILVWGNGISLHYRRGFLDRMDLPTPLFLDQARLLCHVHPLTAIGLTDKTPVKVYGGQWWWADSCLDPTEPACLARYVPPILYRFLTGSITREGRLRQGANPADLTFQTETAARKALSEACISHGHFLRVEENP